MRNKKFLLTLAITVILSFPAAGAVLGAVQEISQRQAFDEPVEVLVASEPIRPYQNISIEHFETRTMPRAATPDDVLTENDLEMLKNGDYHTNKGMYEGDLVRKTHLSDGLGTDSTLVSRLSQKNDRNIRAVPAPKPGGFPIEPGNFLDILYTQGGGRDDVNTRTAFEEVEVLKVNDSNIFLSMNRNEAERFTNMLAQDRITFVFSPVRAR